VCRKVACTDQKGNGEPGRVRHRAPDDKWGGRQPNGVFALHAHWYDFAQLLRTIRNTTGPADVLGRVDQLLVSPRYVHISRHDTAAQALSYYRAIYTGEGEADMRLASPVDRACAEPAPMVLEQLRWLEDTLIDWDAQWRDYFARCDIEPVEVSYEDLDADYQGTIRRVLESLGLASTAGVVDLEAPDRTPPSAWTKRWLDEYRAVRDQLAPQRAEESWSREDRIFDVAPSTEPVVPVHTAGASPSTSRPDDELVFSCVVDKPPLLVYQSLIWVLTLTRLAGRAPEQLVVHVVEGTDPEHLTVLRSLGVQVVPVARFDERNVYGNKLCQVTTGALAHASAAVLCDCDIAFVGDISPLIRGTEIRGRPVGAGVPTLAGWRRLLEAAGLTRELHLARSVRPLTWTCTQNFNGGLLVIPRRFHDLMAEAWPRWFGWILDHSGELGYVVNRFADQVAFGLALIDLDLPVAPLPLATHFSWGGAEASLTDTMSPLNLHYHSHLDRDGRLMEVGSPAVNAVVAKVNALLDEPASREVLEVALRNWKDSFEPVKSPWSNLKPGWLAARKRNP
jgi:LPS sulfotransferase NodH